MDSLESQLVEESLSVYCLKPGSYHLLTNDHKKPCRKQTLKISAALLVNKGRQTHGVQPFLCAQNCPITK